jgi:NADPH-dependent curcumin reductase CurA
MNHAILLDKRPAGRPELSDFNLVTEEKPQIQSGEVLLRTSYVSVDPYLRGRMNDAKSYIPPFELKRPISSGIIAEVVESDHASLSKGDYVSGMLEW